MTTSGRFDMITPSRLRVSLAALDAPRFIDDTNEEEARRSLISIVNRPHRLLIVAGPQRSGKTTFMRAIAAELGQPIIQSAPSYHRSEPMLSVRSPDDFLRFRVCDSASDLRYAAYVTSAAPDSVVVEIHSDSDLNYANHRLESMAYKFTPDARQAFAQHLAGVVIAQRDGDYFTYSLYESARRAG